MRIVTSQNCWRLFSNRTELTGKLNFKAYQMGMDIDGRNPDSEAGKYFRANVWSWRPIHDLIYRLCSDLLDAETLEAIGYNSGAGPTDDETCKEMANRFELWMEHHAEGHGIDIDGMRMKTDGELLIGDNLEGVPDEETLSPYAVDDEHLKEWIEFLRHCGGFEVW